MSFMEAFFPLPQSNVRVNIEEYPETSITNDQLEENRICSICHSEFVQDQHKIRILPCLHYFHSQCIKDWLDKSSTCPLCRHQLPTIASIQPTPSSSGENSNLFHAAYRRRSQSRRRNRNRSRSRSRARARNQSNSRVRNNSRRRSSIRNSQRNSISEGNENSNSNWSWEKFQNIQKIWIKIK